MKGYLMYFLNIEGGKLMGLKGVTTPLPPPLDVYDKNGYLFFRVQ